MKMWAEDEEQYDSMPEIYSINKDYFATYTGFDKMDIWQTSTGKLVNSIKDFPYSANIRTTNANQLLIYDFEYLYQYDFLNVDKPLHCKITTSEDAYANRELLKYFNDFFAFSDRFCTFRANDYIEFCSMDKEIVLWYSSTSSLPSFLVKGCLVVDEEGLEPKFLGLYEGDKKVEIE